MHDQISSHSCPFDGSPLEEIGDCGIVDWDRRWEAQATRYRCRDGHLILVTDAEPIEEAETEAAEQPATGTPGINNDDRPPDTRSSAPCSTAHWRQASPVWKS